MKADVEYVRPRSVDEAIAALEASAGDGLILAGGVVVNSLINQELADPSVIIDISRIEELRTIERRPDGTIRIGALATHEDIRRSEIVRRHAPLLCKIAEEIACGRLCNQGTIGGSICMMGQQGDPATGLLALGARVELRSSQGARTIPIDAFFKDAFTLDLGEDEVVTEILVPDLPRDEVSAFVKFGPRNAMDFTLIACSVVARLNDRSVIETIRIGMNGLASTALRPRGTEGALTGTLGTEIDWPTVAVVLDSEISPEGDLVFSEHYRRRLAGILLRRAINRVLGRGARH